MQLKEFIDDKFPDVVEVYLRSSEGYVEDIVSALEAGDAQKLSDAVHTLKSSSGNLGLMVFSEMCSALELKAIEVLNGGAGFDEVAALAENFEDVYSGSIRALKGYL